MTVNFSALSPTGKARCAWQALYATHRQAVTLLNDEAWRTSRRQNWQHIIANHADNDVYLTDWLMAVFNISFAHQNTLLERGGDEPEYFAAGAGMPARIVFAHGYFASALHEVSHWCIAGQARRKLNDFGYWYAADGRDAVMQSAFEQVEIKPQAIECLFGLACGRYFFVSQDNLNADFDTSASTFAQDVYDQASRYLQQVNSLPKDAAHMIVLLLALCQTDHFL